MLFIMHNASVSYLVTIIVNNLLWLVRASVNVGFGHIICLHCPYVLEPVIPCETR